jgi:hypothetical protein
MKGKFQRRLRVDMCRDIRGKKDYETQNQFRHRFTFNYLSVFPSPLRRLFHSLPSWEPSFRSIGAELLADVSPSIPGPVVYQVQSCFAEYGCRRVQIRLAPYPRPSHLPQEAI